MRFIVKRSVSVCCRSGVFLLFYSSCCFLALFFGVDLCHHFQMYSGVVFLIEHIYSRLISGIQRNIQMTCFQENSQSWIYYKNFCFNMTNTQCIHQKNSLVLVWFCIVLSTTHEHMSLSFAYAHFTDIKFSWFKKHSHSRCHASRLRDIFSNSWHKERSLCCKRFL